MTNCGMHDVPTDRRLQDTGTLFDQDSRVALQCSLASSPICQEGNSRAPAHQSYFSACAPLRRTSELRARFQSLQ